MAQILIYSDSLSWGIIPGTRKRLAFEQRWPGVMENALLAEGLKVRVLEDCLNGRRTVWEDPFKPGRNGLQGLAQRIEMHSPLALVILMLGTNDFQFNQPWSQAWSVAQGVATLVSAIRNAPIEPGMPIPPVLVVGPPRIRSAEGPIALKFPGAEERSGGLAEALHAVAQDMGCAFFNADLVARTSPVDGIHLDADQHEALGLGIAPLVKRLLEETTRS